MSLARRYCAGVGFSGNYDYWLKLMARWHFRVYVYFHTIKEFISLVWQYTGLEITTKEKRLMMKHVESMTITIKNIVREPRISIKYSVPLQNHFYIPVKL